MQESGNLGRQGSMLGNIARENRLSGEHLEETRQAA